MIELLAKRLIPNREDVKSPAVRQAYGTLCGAAGIVLNLLLFAVKALAGVISGSVAITADAFNNLSDAGSSVITLLGFRLAGQKPDADHPFGHGRVEYLSGLAVSMLILLMGFELAKSSLQKIFNPEVLTANWLVIAILAVSVLVKLYMGSYNRRIGRKIDSAAMEATAADCISDCLSTTAVLLATLLGMLFQWQLDGYIGLVVSGLILYSGFNAAKDTIDPLLGKPPAPEFVQQINDLVTEHDEIVGVHDLVVHDYGPGRCMITLHAEVPADGNIMQIHDLIDNVERELEEKLHCSALIHMDPIVCDDGLTTATREKVAEQIREQIHPDITIHDFRMVTGPTHTNLVFDAVLPYSLKLEEKAVEKQIRTLVREMEGNCFAVVTVERSYV